MSLGVEQTPDGRRLAVARRLDRPATAVWELLRDTHCWSEWGPSVSAVESTDRYVTRGTTGRVRVAGTAWLPFEVTSCADYCWRWRVAGVRATGHCVEAVGDSTCRVRFDLPVVAAPYAGVCELALRRIDRLADQV